MECGCSRGATQDVSEDRGGGGRMANLGLGLLGSFRLETSTGVPVLLPTKRAKALLAYLALHPEKPQARSKLAGLLWEDSSDDKALESLRQTLSALRKAATAAGEIC